MISKFKYILIAILLLVVLGLGYRYENLISKEYYRYFVYENFNTGDSVYLKKVNPINKEKVQSINVERLIRKANSEEIDTMNINEHRKLELRLLLEKLPNKTPYIVSGVQSLIISHGSRSIGTFVKSVKLPVFSINRDLTYQYYYILAPKKANLTFNVSQYTFKLPAGYIYADSNYYVFPYLLTNSKL